MTATLVDMGSQDRRAGRNSEKDTDFSAYMAARQPALYRTAYLLAGDHASAEDLLQNAFAKLYLSWDQIRDREALDGYVRRVMVNTQTSFWRRRRVDEHPTGDLPERAAGRDATADLDLHDALWTALAGLPRRQRAAIVLRFYEDLPFDEIAELLGCRPATARTAVHRGLAALRGEIDR